MANISKKEEKKESISVQDIFTGENELITIPLDKSLNIVENAQQYYKKNKKAERTRLVSEKRLSQLLAEKQEISKQIDFLENAGSLSELKKYFQEKSATIPKTKSKIKKENYYKGILQFTSNDGYTIFVGKSDTANHYLITKIANGRDWWFHALGIPGSHVVVKIKDKEDLPKETIIDAATLAAINSQNKGKSGCTIEYTQRKYVKTIKGSKPGQVAYSKPKAIYIITDPNRLARLTKK